MNNKRTRLASAVLALAMLLGTLPVTAAAEESVQAPETVTEPVAVSETAQQDTPADGNEVHIDTVAKLAEAIKDQQNNQTWYISEGTYVLTADDLAEYGDWTNPYTSQQTGWYFPLHADGLTLIGEGDVVITSDVETANGAWATQDFVTVWGNDITIDNVDFLSKSYQNKVIEVMGQDFTLRNAEMKKVDEWGSGSITFNSQVNNGDIGTATLENVKLYAWVSTNYSKTGTLNATNVTVDFTDNEYAGYYSDTYGYGWCPGIFNNNSNVTVNNENLTIVVDNEINLPGQIFNGKMQEDTAVVLTTGEYDVTTTGNVGGNEHQGTGMIINQNNVTIKAADPANKPVIYGFSTAANAGVTDGINGQDTVYVSGQNVTLENLKIMPLGGINANTNSWQKTVEVTNTAADFEMIGCETLANTKSENSMDESAGLIHISTDDAVLAGNAFGDGTQISAGWKNSDGGVVTEYYKVTANSNTGDPALEGIVIVDGVAYVTDEVALKQAVADAEISSIALANDITLTEKLTINKDITIDGNAHTIKGQNNNAGVYIEITGGDVTIQNAALTEFGGAVGTVNGAAVIKVPDTAANTTNVVASGLDMSMFNRAAFAFDAGTFTVNECAIDCDNDSPDNYKLSKGVYAGYDAEGAVTGTTITNSASDYAEWTAAAIEVWDSAQVTVSNCTLTNMTDGIYLFAATEYGSPANSTGKVILSNNTVNVTGYAVTASYGYGDEDHDLSIEIQSGDYTGDVYAYAVDLNSYIEGSHPCYDEYPADADIADITITGGTFSVNPSDYVASGYRVTESDGVYIVSSIPSTNPGSGSTTTDKTETTTNPDGSTTTTVTKPDGSTTETTKAPNGSSSVVNTNKDGQIEAEVKLPETVVSDAADKGETVTLPMPEVPVTTDKETAPTVTVSLPANTTAKVEIPVENVTAGTVAILVKADGTEEIIKTSVATENGLAVALSDGDTVKIVDNSKDFADVAEGYWGSDAVAFATSRELFNGTSATSFSPESDMNRAMIVTVLARYEGVDTTGGDNWYDQGVEWAKENGISDGTNLNDSVTREQLAAMLYRYAGEPEVTGTVTGFADSGSVSDWASDAMTWAVQNGIISGNNGMLDAQGTATRAQVATILMRFVAMEF